MWKTLLTVKDQILLEMGQAEKMVSFHLGKGQVTTPFI